MIRYEFIDDSVNEASIHPNSIFVKEQSLIKAFLGEVTRPAEIAACPLSGKERQEVLFEKWGFQYVLCPDTWTVSVASMPDIDLLSRYFYSSELATFRASTEYQAQLNQLRSGLWDNQLEWIEGRINRYLGRGQYQVTDWGSKSVGWVKAVSKAKFQAEMQLVQPLPPLVESPIIGQSDIVLALDVLQRQVDPKDWIASVKEVLRTDGLFIMTCRAGTGFDILTLREKSNSIFPMDHLILPSPKGLEQFLTANGFEVLEITTPGMLDVDMLKKQQEDIPQDQYFQRYVMSQDSGLLQERLQLFLQQNNLSSHLRVVAKKTEVKI